jgi:hypothetical protein
MAFWSALTSEVAGAVGSGERRVPAVTYGVYHPGTGVDPGYPLIVFGVSSGL